MAHSKPANIDKNKFYSSEKDKVPELSELKIISLENQSGARIDILNYGARITGVWLPVKGKFINIVLGYKNLEDYLTDRYFMGGITGRYCNRIKNSRVRINGSDYQLTSNEGNNHLHGGAAGFHARCWEFLPQTSSDRISLHYTSRDGEEGYPGNLEVTATYVWTDSFELTLEITATTDKETVINLTNHAYFNLDGDQHSILNHEVMLNAGHYTPIDKEQIPTGEIKPLQGTIFDFTQTSKIGEKILQGRDSKSFKDGFDHNYVLKKYYGSNAIHVATLCSNANGLSMKLYTNTPGLQFYTGNYLRDPFLPFGGLCLETQNFPDAPNRRNFPNAALKPGEKYNSITRYSFNLPNQ